MARVKVIRRLEVPSAQPTRLGKIDYWISYEVDGAGPFILVMPKEEFSEARFLEKVREEIRATTAFVGKEFTI